MKKRNAEHIGLIPAEVQHMQNVAKAIIKTAEGGKTLPPQEQAEMPGKEHKMSPIPIPIKEDYQGSDCLKDKVAIITGGDSGIGRAVAYHYISEGAKVVINYLNEDDDAITTKQWIEDKGGECLIIAGDISDEAICKKIVDKTLQHFHKIDIVVSNAATQYESDIEHIEAEKLKHIFAVNVFSAFYLLKYAVPHLKADASIIITTSVTAYRGSKHLLDYSATKSALVGLIRSLSSALVEQGIRVNGVAPGPIWTPLIPASFSKEKVEKFGSQTPMKRPGEPWEVAPCYVFLASKAASYLTGQVLHPNGGEIING